MSITRYIQMFSRIDKLIRRHSTGTPKELAQKLEVSESSVYNLINQMKYMNAPIRYCPYQRSYIYDKKGKLSLGFFEELDPREEAAIHGGGFKISLLFIQSLDQA